MNDIRWGTGCGPGNGGTDVDIEFTSTVANIYFNGKRYITIRPAP